MTLSRKVAALLLALVLSTVVAGAALRFGLELTGFEQRWGAGAAAALAFGLTALAGAGLAVAAAVAVDRAGLARLRALSAAALASAEAAAGDAPRAVDGADAPFDEIDAIERSLA